jgi:heme/copper-type cytochrome/quinol oxidase subunit 1
MGHFVRLPMLAAKLFLVSAVVFAFVSFFSRSGWGPVIDISVHATYIVLGRVHLLLISALICGLYAALYIFSEKVLKVAVNQPLSVVQFALTSLGLIALNLITNARIGPGRAVYIATARMEGETLVPWLLVAVVCAYLLLLLGGALFVANLAWVTIAKAIRTNT